MDMRNDGELLARRGLFYPNGSKPHSARGDYWTVPIVSTVRENNNQFFSFSFSFFCLFSFIRWRRWRLDWKSFFSHPTGRIVLKICPTFTKERNVFSHGRWHFLDKRYRKLKMREKEKKSKVFFQLCLALGRNSQGKNNMQIQKCHCDSIEHFQDSCAVWWGSCEVERRRKMRWLNQRVGQDNGQKIQTHKVEPIQLTASGSLSNLRSGRADASRSHSPVIYSCLYGLPILHFRRPWRLPYLRTANYHLDLSKYWIDDIVCISSLLLLCVCQAEKTAVQFNWWFE